MAVHVAYIAPTPVLNGVVIDKNKATIAEVMKADTEMRVLPSADNTNTSDSPDVKTYIERENNSGYTLKSMTNTIIVTEK